jgi:16S rRNA (cytosine967-C5)-methyltransferase
VAATPVVWPDEPTRLSYPDWVVERVVADLGPDDGLGALAAMNLSPPVTERADGYVQDLASQWVVDAVEAAPGERVADLCAAPGGKATGLAASGAQVVAVDLNPVRAGLVVANAARVGARLPVVAADARSAPFRAASFDRVLVDAPCSGLGVLGRRADARWRVSPEAVHRLAQLQREILDGAVALVRPGGVLVYSVCTLTAAETTAVDDWLAAAHPGLEPLAGPAAPWRPHGRGSLLLPQAAGTDGMALFRYRVP